MSALGRAGKLLDRFTGSASTKYILNRLIRNYGRLVELQINPGERKIRAAVLLSGEQQPVDLNIEEYRIIINRNSTSFVIKTARSSRPWVNAILRDFIIDRHWPLPENKKELIQDFLG